MAACQPRMATIVNGEEEDCLDVYGREIIGA